MGIPLSRYLAYTDRCRQLTTESQSQSQAILRQSDTIRAIVNRIASTANYRTYQYHAPERIYPTMQVFLPYPDYRQSLNCLDNSRLGNQIYREALTLLRDGWSNHPAYIMWQYYKHSLCSYCLIGLDILSKRGRHYPHHYTTFITMQKSFKRTGKPWWLGDNRIHRSHRAALLHKDYNHYSRFGWKEQPTTPPHPYYWPKPLPPKSRKLP